MSFTTSRRVAQRGRQTAFVRGLFATVLGLCAHTVLYAGLPYDHVTELQKLQAAQAKWAGLGLVSYSYTVRSACYCSPEWWVPVRVTVVTGKITRAVYAGSSDNIREGIEVLRGSPRWTSLQSVVDLFKVIEKALTDRATNVTVEYDVPSGYPLIFAAGDTSTDSWIRLSITDLQFTE